MPLVISGAHSQGFGINSYLVDFTNIYFYFFSFNEKKSFWGYVRQKGLFEIVNIE